MLELHASLLAEWPSLGDGLSAANTLFEAEAGAHAELTSLVSWRVDQASQPLACVWSAGALMSHVRAGTLNTAALAVSAAGVRLIVVGSVPGLERATAWLAVEIGMSVLTVATPAELCALYARTRTPSRAPGGPARTDVSTSACS